MEKNKENIEKWISELASAQKTLNENRYFDRTDGAYSLCISTFGSIFIEGDVEEVAVILGVEIKHSPWKCGKDKAIRTSFIYNGIEFYTLEEYSHGSD